MQTKRLISREAILLTWPINRLGYDKIVRINKIDTCALTPAARDEIRKRVILLRQQSGLNAEALAAIADVHPGTVLKWLSKARKAGVGSLTEKPRGRPVGSCRVNDTPLSLIFDDWRTMSLQR